MSDALDAILLRSDRPDFAAQIEALRRSLITGAAFAPDSPEYQQVIDILRSVARDPDVALIEYTRQYDGVGLARETLRVSSEELRRCHGQIDKDLMKSVRRAIANVRAYQKRIFVGPWLRQVARRSNRTGIRVTPIASVGVCVPGASAPLPSTVIMTVVPAQVAGVKRIAVVSPPRHNGAIHPVIQAVCWELGVDEVYRVGGAQAVAALASEHGTIPKVDKIVGPGNRWVQTAKRLVGGRYVGIDSIAGPSEVLIVANSKANAAWVAADMLSQAEHDPGSAVLVTDSQPLAEAVLTDLKTQVRQLSRADSTQRCLTDFSRIIVFGDLDEAIDFANSLASEHLQVQCGPKSRSVAKRIVNAGAIFIGPYSPVAVGDYWAGPSHTLPTGTTARFFSALSSNDFIKTTSIIEYGKTDLAAAADDIERLARTEGLDAHARSVHIRRP